MPERICMRISVDVHQFWHPHSRAVDCRGTDLAENPGSHFTLMLEREA